ncbi:hypothetical protein BROUX41_005325 [Berkeleyomyces rouxiae]|uniref:uncharacterized protein n=1 Tax=Berkeleyomyces rouxiae TaxID=2035830 RepID=UPI003B776C59
MDPPELPPEAFTARESYFLFRAIHVFQTLDFTLLSKKLIANEFINGADEFDETRLTPRRLWGLFRHYFLAELPNPPTQLTPDLIVDKYKNITTIDQKLGEIYYTRLKREVLSDAQREQEAAKRQADLEVEQKRICESLLKSANAAAIPSQLAATASGVGISNAVPIAPAAPNSRTGAHAHSHAPHGLVQSQTHHAHSPRTSASISPTVSPLAAPGPEMASKKTSAPNRLQPTQQPQGPSGHSSISAATHQVAPNPRIVVPATTQPVPIQSAIARPTVALSSPQVLQTPGAPTSLATMTTRVAPEGKQNPQFHQLPPKPPQPQSQSTSRTPSSSPQLQQQESNPPQPQAQARPQAPAPTQPVIQKQSLEERPSVSPQNQAGLASTAVSSPVIPSATINSPQAKASLPFKSQSPQVQPSENMTAAQNQALKWERPYTPQNNTPVASHSLQPNTANAPQNGSSACAGSTQTRTQSSAVSGSQWTPNRFQIAHAPGQMPEQAQAHAVAQAKAQAQVPAQAQIQAQLKLQAKAQQQNQVPIAVKPATDRPQAPQVQAQIQKASLGHGQQQPSRVQHHTQQQLQQQVEQRSSQVSPPLAAKPLASTLIPSSTSSTTSPSLPNSQPQAQSQPTHSQQQPPPPVQPVKQQLQDAQTQVLNSLPESKHAVQGTPIVPSSGTTAKTVSGPDHTQPQNAVSKPPDPNSQSAQPSQQTPLVLSNALSKSADQVLPMHPQTQVQTNPSTRPAQERDTPISVELPRQVSKQASNTAPESVMQAYPKATSTLPATPVKQQPHTQPLSPSPSRQPSRPPAPVTSTPNAAANALSQQLSNPIHASLKSDPPTSSNLPLVAQAPDAATAGLSSTIASAATKDVSSPVIAPQLQHNQSPPVTGATSAQATKSVTSIPQPQTPFAKVPSAIPDHLETPNKASTSTSTVISAVSASAVKSRAVADPHTPIPQNQALFIKRGHGTNWTLDSTPSTPGPANTVADSPAWEPLSPPPPRPPPTPTITHNAHLANSTSLPPTTPSAVASSTKGTPRRINRHETPVSRGSALSKRATRTGRAAHMRSRRSQSVLSQPDDPSMDTADAQGSGSRIKNEDVAAKMEETGDTTADESVTSKRCHSSIRAGKRKRQDSTDSGYHRPRPLISTPTPAVQVGPPTHVRWTRGFPRVSASVLDQIGSHRDANMFANPIREKDAPNYSTIVLQPVDIASIKKAISHGNKIAIQAAAALPDGDPGTASVDLPISEDLVPPRGIINSEQLERSLVHMFCNAVMYNPDPDRGPGVAFLAGANHGGNGSENIGYQVDEFGVVNDTRNMFLEVDKLMAELRGAEMQRNGGSLQPPPVPTASSVSSSGAATARAISLATTGGGDDTDEVDELATDDVASTTVRRSRRG